MHLRSVIIRSCKGPLSSLSLDILSREGEWEGKGKAPLAKNRWDCAGRLFRGGGRPSRKGVDSSEEPSGKGPQGHDAGFGVPEAPPEGPSGVCAWSCRCSVDQQMVLVQYHPQLRRYECAVLCRKLKAPVENPLANPDTV